MKKWSSDWSHCHAGVFQHRPAGILIVKEVRKTASAQCVRGGQPTVITDSIQARCNRREARCLPVQSSAEQCLLIRRGTRHKRAKRSTPMARGHAHGWTPEGDSSCTQSCWVFISSRHAEAPLSGRQLRSPPVLNRASTPKSVFFCLCSTSQEPGSCGCRVLELSWHQYIRCALT